jgi:hypothetical protein
LKTIKTGDHLYKQKQGIYTSFFFIYMNSGFHGFQAFPNSFQPVFKRFSTDFKEVGNNVHLLHNSGTWRFDDHCRCVINRIDKKRNGQTLRWEVEGGHDASYIVYRGMSASWRWRRLPPSSVVRRQSPFVRRPSSAIRRPSSVVRRLSSVAVRPSSVVRRPSSVVRRPSSVVRRASPLAHHWIAHHWIKTATQNSNHPRDNKCQQKSFSVQGVDFSSFDFLPP